ncbi:MAG TPA: PilZ domain-containing protein [Phycisphaerae bacterium]|nr:PilZ domain-containing protein [Phycisphaerae bacterium]HRR84522.1 PilZ domain-containing protein [Phycisphaerae bacterium]
MNTLFPMEAAHQANVLADAIEDLRPALATWRQGDRWAAYETRFVNVDYSAGELTLQYDASEQGVPELSDGQEVCVSFRRGRRRCAFDTVVLGRGRAPVGDAETVSTIRLKYPRELCELQRRTYYRQKVPANVVVPVSLSIASDGATTAADARGNLLDISPDGMGVHVTEGSGMSFDVAFLADCTLHVQAGATPIRVRARVCSRTNTPDGLVRLGLQFVDDDQLARARADLARLLASVRT